MGLSWARGKVCGIFILRAINEKHSNGREKKEGLKRVYYENQEKSSDYVHNIYCLQFRVSYRTNNNDGYKKIKLSNSKRIVIHFVTSQTSNLLTSSCHMYCQGLGHHFEFKQTWLRSTSWESWASANPYWRCWGFTYFSIQYILISHQVNKVSNYLRW